MDLDLDMDKGSKDNRGFAGRTQLHTELELLVLDLKL